MYYIQVIHKSLRDFRPLRYSSRDGHAEGEHVNRGTYTCNVCGRNLNTGLTSAASPRLDISSTCKVGQKLGVSLLLLTWCPSTWPYRLLYRRGRKSRRDLWITLYIPVTWSSIWHKWLLNNSNIKWHFFDIKVFIDRVRVVTNLYFLVTVIFITRYSLGWPLTQQLMLRK